MLSVVLLFRSYLKNNHKSLLNHNNIIYIAF